MRLFSLLISFAVLLAAQGDANRAQIIGTVFDPNRAPVAGAKLRIENLATGSVRHGSADGAGQYRLLQLDAGRYRITAESPGFAPATVDGIVLSVGASLGVDITLQLQPISTTMDVGDTLLNVALPAPTAAVNQNAIAHLPINGRRFQDFGTLTPTVQIEPARQQLSFAGQRGVNANAMLDGADYSQPFFGGIRGGERSNFSFTVPQGAIQEFQVITTGYAAEYGRSTGGILNAITKSGGNSLHGDTFYQRRPKNWAGMHPIVHRRPSETLQQYGASAGGPIRENRLFWFGAFEQQRAETPRQVLFAQLTNRNPTAATQEALAFFRGEERSFDQTNRASALTGRTDYHFPAGHRLTFRYNFSDSKESNAVSTGGALNPLTSNALSNEGTEKDRTHTGTMQYTHLLSAHTVHDLKFTGSYEIRPREANASTPTVTATPVGAFGARNFLPTVQDDLRYQITDGVSLTRGRHTMKVGVDYSRITTAQSFGLNQYGAFTVTADVTRILTLLSAANGQNRFDGREVTYARQIGNLAADYGVHQFAFYGQDSYRLHRKLTLDYGLRWEGQWNPKVEASNTALADRLRGFRFPNGAVLEPERIANRPTQWMPRLGIAYVPFSGARRMVIRAHTGLFYAATPLLLYSGHTNNLRNPPGDVSITLAPTATQTVYQQLLAAGVDLNSTPLSALPVIPVEAVQRAAALAAGGTARDPFAGIGLTMMAADYRNPRSFQAGLGVEREVTANLVAGVQLHYVNTVHLHRNRDYNLPAPTIRAGDQRPVYGLRTQGRLRPIPSLGTITVRESSARSLYRGFTVQAQYRRKRVQFAAFYTMSSNYSDDDSERDASSLNYDNPGNFLADYGYSNLDAKHQFTSNTLVQLPWGFESALIFRLRSGAPMNARTVIDQNEDLSGVDRPYSSPGVPFRRNSFRNREVTFNDLRVVRNFHLGSETRRLQFSVELFNMLGIDNVVFGPNASFYGPGISEAGGFAPIDPRFQRLKLPDGTYDANNQQVGNPFQAQVGLRLFF
ncbi:MAG: TonB-dependent receptor [Bryobacterales bacterium]|nr:TonB-dependent receptor [Bryobacterales bacterium]